MNIRARQRKIAVATVILGMVSASVTGTSVAAPEGPCPGGPFGTPLPSPNLTATKIKDGFNFLEGPTWDAATQTLLLSNMYDGTGPQNVQPSDILRYTPSTGTFTTFVKNAGSNGLAISRDGTSVLAATHDQRSLSSYDLATGRRTTIAATYQGRLFNSPNDVTVAANGTAYFTDPNFQRANRPDQMSGRTGVFRVTNGVVTLIDDTIRQPNGIELLPGRQDPLRRRQRDRQDLPLPRQRGREHRAAQRFRVARRHRRRHRRLRGKPVPGHLRQREGLRLLPGRQAPRHDLRRPQRDQRRLRRPRPENPLHHVGYRIHRRQHRKLRPVQHSLERSRLALLTPAHFGSPVGCQNHARWSDLRLRPPQIRIARRLVL
ncbi:SMP-30/gluconolactonase/LRE family protein [Lentzea chajnantorensis]